MQQIDSLTADPNQIWTMALADGTLVQFQIIYRSTVQRWFFNFSHPLKSANGIALSMYPNLLRPWKKIVPFGLACMTTDGYDPIYVNDFVSGRAALYFLENAQEVLDVEQSIFGEAFV